MKRWGWLSLILTLGLAASSFAAPVQQAEQAKPLEVIDITKRIDGLSLQLQVEEPELFSVETEDGEALLAEFHSNVGTIEEEGMPLLPAISEFFRLPPTGGVTVNLLNAEYETLYDIDYASYFSSEGQEQLGITDESVDAWYPENIVDVSEPAIMRDFRVSTLKTYPVQVNPARRQVRVYSNVEVDIEFNNNASSNELPRDVHALSEVFLPWYRQFLDWSDAELDDYEIYRGGVQVVVKEVALGNDNQVDEPFDEWIQWKRQKGWNIELITESDCSWSSTGIKNELQSRWNAAERKFDYIVIVGDNSGTYGTPASGNVDYNGYGDHGYALLEGGDLLPDAAVGRISVETGSQMNAYVQKVLSYEKYPVIPENPDNSWYKHGLVAAGSNSSGLSTIQLGRFARYKMFELGYTRVDTAWYNDGLGNVNSRDQAFINNGVSFFSYRGWLNTGMPPSTISSLNNTNMLPMVLDITCGTGNWHDGTGNNEAWMRAGTAQLPRGGIAAIATATSHTHTRFNNSLSGGAIEAGIILRQPCAGDYLYGSKVNLFKNYNGFYNAGVNEFSYWANLMGDPTVWVWTDAPDSLLVTYPSVVQMGTSAIEVQVQDETPSVVPGAWVSLYKEQDGLQFEVVSHTISDQNGCAVIDVPFMTTGTLILTVTKQNSKPTVGEIELVDGDNLAIAGYSVTDNGSDETSGNGNGIPEAGETIGLTFNVENNADVTRNDVVLSIDTDDDLVDITTAEVSLGAINAGQSVIASDMIMIEISDQVQDDWVINFDVDIDHEGGVYSDILSMNLAAPKYSVMEVDLDGVLNPGETTDANITLKNVGHSDGMNGTATLISMDPYLTVVQNTATVPSILEGQNGVTGDFTIAAHVAAFKGYPANYKVVIESSGGVTDTAYGTIYLGHRSTSDPIGPDKYGYFAFDNTDTEYDLCPTYDWIEINPSSPESVFDGTRLNINDSSEEHEDAEVLTLPFTFQYYGEEFQRITVSGNGFIAMGDQRDLSVPRNWSIPSPLGPDYMIAPYWDDRIISGGGVYIYYDSAGGRYIIQWDDTQGYSYGPDGHYCTFQLIIYEQTGGHMTLSGDNEFQFQYQSMDHSTGDSADNPYFTTGIENGDQQDGLMYSYWNTPVTGAASVNNGRAILYTTLTELITGQITGRVTYLTGGDPVIGVVVRTDDNMYSTVTNGNGEYLLDRVVIGQHYLVIEGDGLNPITSDLITVEEDEATQVNFEVTQPMFELSETQLYIEVENGGETTHDITVTNNGDGEMDFDVSLDFWGPTGSQDYLGEHPSTGLDEIWDLLYGFELDAIETKNRGFMYDAEYMWVCGSNSSSSTDPNRIYRYDTDGQLIDYFDQPVPNFDAVGFYSITQDEEYFYGSEDGVMYKMSFDGTEFQFEDSWELPLNPARNIVYDPDREVFWMCDWSTPLYGVNSSGEIEYEYDTGLTVRGMALYPDDELNHELYIIAQEFGNSTASLNRMNVETGNINFIRSFGCGDATVLDMDITYHWNPMVYALVLMFDAGSSSQDYTEIYELANNAAWIDFDVESATVDPGSSQEIQLTFNSLDLPSDVYSCYLKFNHNAVGGESFVEIDFGIGVDVDDETQSSILPTEFSFDGVYPNPFNPTTTVKFGLPQGALVKAKLYNILGQQVSTLVNRQMPAGNHSIMINGENLSSGVYFLKFSAGPMEETQKVILLK